jgi:hypothetical protein
MKQKMLPGKGKKGLTGKQCDQGGQMSLWNSCPKCGPTVFLSKIIHNFLRRKGVKKIGLLL